MSTTLRYTPEGIRGLLKSFCCAQHAVVPEPWRDLMEEIMPSGVDLGLVYEMIEATYFLESTFPGRTWGWQDFDQLISECLSGYWESRKEIGLTRAMEIVDATEELAKGENPGRVGPLRLSRAKADTMSESELVDFGLSEPGTHVVASVLYPGKVVVFNGVRSIEDVTR